MSRRAARRRSGLSPSLIAAAGAGLVALAVIAFVAFGGGVRDSSASTSRADAAPAAAASQSAAKPTFTAEDWAKAVELAEKARSLAAEADAARDHGEEGVRKRKRAEALDSYTRAIAICQKMNELPDGEQTKLNERYGDTVHRWTMAKRKLM